jgi:hypothetical protein
MQDDCLGMIRVAKPGREEAWITSLIDEREWDSRRVYIKISVL